MTPNRSPWREVLAPFAVPCPRRGMLSVATSAVPYVALSVLMYLLLPVSPALTLVLAIPAAGFLVRVFVVFHDCAHGSLLPSKRANAAVGSVLGLFVLSPFTRWRHDHAQGGRQGARWVQTRRGRDCCERLRVSVSGVSGFSGCPSSSDDDIRCLYISRPTFPR